MEPGHPVSRVAASTARRSSTASVHMDYETSTAALCRRLVTGARPAARRCATFERAVSGWFYDGHHPGSDYFRAGWPPVDSFLDGGTSTQISFANYARTRAYSNVYTRMLGMNGHAYDGATPDGAALERAKHVLTRIPFALLADMERSYVLFAHAHSRSKADCARLKRRLLPLARSRVRGAADRSGEHERLLADPAKRVAFERYNGLDRALYANATATWCAAWARAMEDRTSCVRAYAHEHPGVPAPCR